MLNIEPTDAYLFYCAVDDIRHSFIVTELCDGTLHDLVVINKDYYSKLTSYINFWRWFCAISLKGSTTYTKTTLSIVT